MAQHIKVVEYDPSWPLLFEDEASLIKGILKDNLVAIHHIGSTSVPFLAAKPIIDIMPVVKDLSAVDAVSDEFVKIGYEYLGPFGIESYSDGKEEFVQRVETWAIDEYNNRMFL